MSFRLATLASSLAAASALVSPATFAAQDCMTVLVYAVNNICRMLPNGYTQCQPVATVAPASGCRVPGAPPLAHLPMGPAILNPPGRVMPAGPGYAQPYLAPWSAFQAYQPFPPQTIPTQPQTAAPSAPPAAPSPVPVAPQPTAPTVSPPPEVAAVASGTPNPFAAALAEVQAPPTAPPVAVEKLATPAVAPEQAVPVPQTVPAAPQVEDALAHFAFDSNVLTDAGKAELDAWFAQAPKGVAVRITGHADRLGSAPYNLALSRRRAESVKQYLIGKGMEVRAIRLAAKGEAAPVKRCAGGANAATIDCLAPNRRVEIDPD
jgi:outer membrane protein OmpA-like peptidoglycan-associated protein